MQQPPVSRKSQLRLAYITAGAGGMLCGSCLHDNTLARALIQCGIDVQLIPLYTPIRTDETNVSIDRVFFGGVNVFLQEKIPLFRRLPPVVDRWLDAPWLLRLVTSRAIGTNAQQLGALTLSMLQGADGHQRKEVGRLCDWLDRTVQPDLLDLSNMLIAGCVPAIKQRLNKPVLVTLQGDDVFLEALVEPYKSQVRREIKRLVQHVDGFIVHSRYYANFMGDYFEIPPAKIHIVPLGIDTADFVDLANLLPAARDGQPPTVGYLARLAPEKGLHVLVDAFLRLRQRPGMQAARLKLAGWLGENNRAYAKQQFAKLRDAGLGDAFEYAGEVDRPTKIRFLSQIDVLSVPSVYRDPKGLYVLEALAAGIPVVQPQHGAFPELIERLAGGRLVPPEDPAALADTLHEVLADSQGRRELGQRGCQIVHRQFNAQRMAEATLEVYRQFAAPAAEPT